MREIWRLHILLKTCKLCEFFLLPLLCFIKLVGSDFSYTDFATLCYPDAPCPPTFAGTLECCVSFDTDAASMLILNGGVYFQTCAQINSPSGDIAGLTGRSAVTSSDTEQDPQIWITQLTEVLTKFLSAPVLRP